MLQQDWELPSIESIRSSNGSIANCWSGPGMFARWDASENEAFNTTEAGQSSVRKAKAVQTTEALSLRMVPAHLTEIWVEQEDGAVCVISDRTGAGREFCLNAVGGRVWQLCDGIRSLDEILDAFRGTLQNTAPPRESLISPFCDFLLRLAEEGLLDIGERQAVSELGG